MTTRITFKLFTYSANEEDTNLGVLQSFELSRLASPRFSVSHEDGADSRSSDFPDTDALRGEAPQIPLHTFPALAFWISDDTLADMGSSGGSDGSNSSKLSASILVRLEEDLMALVEAESRSRRVSKAFIVRELLRERFGLVPARPVPQALAQVVSQEAA